MQQLPLSPRGRHGETTTTTVIPISTSPTSGPTGSTATNGDGTFDRRRRRRLGVVEPADGSFPTWFFDFDNDGDLDIFVAQLQHTKVAADLTRPGSARRSTRWQSHRSTSTTERRLHRRLGERSASTDPLLVMGANYGDLDNDGWKGHLPGHRRARFRRPDAERHVPQRRRADGFERRHLHGRLRPSPEGTRRGVRRHRQRRPAGDLPAARRRLSRTIATATRSTRTPARRIAGWCCGSSGARSSTGTASARADRGPRRRPEGERTRSVHQLVGAGGSFGGLEPAAGDWPGPCRSYRFDRGPLAWVREAPGTARRRAERGL